MAPSPRPAKPAACARARNGWRGASGARSRRPSTYHASSVPERSARPSPTRAKDAARGQNASDRTKSSDAARLAATASTKTGLRPIPSAKPPKGSSAAIATAA